MPEEIQNLSQLLRQLERLAIGRERITLDQVLEVTGQRSFAPLLLVAGLILFSPLSGIPGMPTLMGVVVLLVSIQMLLMRGHLWLPAWLLRRSISQSNFYHALHWLKRPAQVIDHWLRPRLPMFVYRGGTYLIAVVCTVIALALPLMEVVPFSASIAGIALAAFGLALVAHDGLLALVAAVITGLVPGLIVNALL
ncbi:exopolysaccharide biosynthesis protein [Microbulbifer bruguierae]|uniref:Exopolysaccharide biosynthesis protein n=1 Tax=Microbulbifer bruguierae TaxID=3029061 RepID=A0ABY8NEJ1_9GAMM|nr:exopolysaccharide biosynthesis protein [Microbulbifer bruguierae]WGL17341.1 exopolysaccharide biosynthesis protein [Microbulbifer bruguierae]